MKTFLIIVPIFLLFSFVSELQADDLKDFKDKIEQEEKNNQAEEADEDEDKENQEAKDSDDDDSDDDDNSFMDFLWEFTFLIWYIHNETVYYTPYPFNESGMLNGVNFIGHDRRSNEEIESSEIKTKDYFFSFYGGVTINESLHNIGGLLRFTGKFFNHLGPEVDYRILWDGENLFHNFSGGFNLAFFQFDYFSLDFYIKAVVFSGFIEKQGVSLGGKMTTYPFKPISLEVRSGGVFFSALTLAEVEIKLGIHIGPAEIFGDFYTLQSTTAQIYSFGLGLGYHF